MMPLLASRHTVVAADFRGADHSGSTQDGYDKASIAADVQGVTETLGFQRHAVCGHDIAAMTASCLYAS
jgi:haloacetate dehalogenase